jgi:hypothetical protein
MYIVQRFDVSNNLRYFDFGHEAESRSEVANYLLEKVLSRTPNDVCWVDVHDGKFYHQTSTTPVYTNFNTLFDQRSGDQTVYPDTWESLETYLQDHCVNLGWACRGCTELKIVELSADEIATFKASVDPKWGNVPYTTVRYTEDEYVKDQLEND